MHHPTYGETYDGAGDSLLIKDYLDGNQKAFEELVTRHRAKMISSILTITKDRDVAEDLYQDALIKIVKVLNKGGYNEKGKFLPWALRLCRNLAIDFFRKEKRNPQINASDNTAFLDNFYSTSESREREFIREENKRFVRDIIRELPENQREVLIMRHYNKMSFKEIAQLTDVSINTALGRMRYALVNLRKLADERGYTM
ncbi:MAG: RNA polymerase sigma factor [Bacteroidota bacterium]